MIIYVIFGVVALSSWLIQYRLKSKFEKYSKIPLGNGMSGKDVAEKMLRDNNISDVKVISTNGHLTDHYNPANKTVNLSESVYSSASVAAAAVAAHECGHAIQHAHSYAFLQMRSKLVPVVSFASNWVQWVLLAGILLMQIMPEIKFAGFIIPSSSILLTGIVLFAFTTLFSFITLPVEVNASSRALAWMSKTGITNAFNHNEAKDALKWAAYTYVVAALGSLATLVYYIFIFLGRRN